MKIHILKTLLSLSCLTGIAVLIGVRLPSPSHETEGTQPRHSSQPANEPDADQPISTKSILQEDTSESTDQRARNESWLAARTTEVLLDAVVTENGFPIHTRILRTTFHKPLLRSETRYIDGDSQSQRQPISHTLSVANEFIAKLAPDADYDSAATLARKIGAQAIPIRHSPGHLRIVFSEGGDLKDLPALARSLFLSPNTISYIEPDYLLQSTATSPNDPLFSKQTNLQSPDNHDIDAPEAWDINHDASSGVIAIIDTGIRTTHQDIAPNLWKNPLEIANGIDDDQNGIIDDLHGFNAIESNGSIEDDNGHGTHVAGIAGARGNNGVGIAGVAWRTQLMPLKFLDSTGFGTTSDAIACINYANTQNVDVINNSWGGSSHSQALYESLSAASRNGILIATSAGNEFHLLDEQPVYPASFSIPNQLVVIATTSTGEIAPYSNYSPLLSHIAAPGQVISTFNTDDSAYTELAGTSMATPQVSGALALLKSHLPNLSPVQISSRLLDSVDITSDLSGYSLSGGRLNLNRALLGESNTPENDTFAQASQIPQYGGRISGSTTRAKTEEGEPLPNHHTQGNTVWHKWSPPQDGHAQLLLTPFGFASTLTVYEGETLSTLNVIASESSTFISNQVLLALEFRAENTYYFQIDSISTDSGPYSFEIALAATNDSFDSPTQLQGRSFNALATNQAASSEEGEAPIHPSASGSSVWFEWTAPSDGDFYLRANQATSQMFASVFTGKTIAALASVEANYEDRNFRNLLFQATAGTTYRFAVDSLSSSGSSFNIEGSYFDEPKIISQPNDQTARLGSAAQFSVTVFGLGTPTYQWLKDGTEIQGAKSQTLNLDKIEEEDLGNYKVRIQIASRTLYSLEAKLSLLGNYITFSNHPNSLSIVNGSTLEISATVVEAPEGLSYQWTKNGTPIDNQNRQTLKIENVKTSDSGFYSLRVSDGKSVAESNPAHVLIDQSSVPSTFSWAQFNPNYFRGHIHRAGEYIIADESDYISFSSDGYHWQFIPTHGSQIAYLNGYYYAAMHDGVYRSENMNQWLQVYSDNTSSFNGIVAGNGILLCRTNSQVLSSTNGTSWTPRLNLSSGSITTLKFGGGRFLIRNANEIRVSNDGQVWETASLPETSAHKLSYASGKWWLFKGESKQAYVSTDAKTWETYEHPFEELMDVFSDLDSSQTYLIGITPDPERYSASFIDIHRVGENGTDFVQTLHHGYDTYYPETAAIGGQVLVYIEGGPTPIESVPNYLDYNNKSKVWWKKSKLSYANSKFIATYGGRLRSSIDGTNWRIESSSESDFGKVVHGNGIYVGTNHYGRELSSLTPHNRNFSDIVFSSNLFAGVTGDNIYHSSDGASWTEAETQVSNIYNISAGGGVFVSYYDNEIFSSTNGSHWTKADLSEDIRFSQVAYGNQRFVAFSGKQSYTSNNGTNWVPQGAISTPNTGGGQVDNLLFTQGKFIATYSNDTYFESTDATTWRQLPFSSSNISFNQHISYAASPDALLLCSKLGIGIIGAPPSSSLSAQITSPAKQVEVSLGTEVTITFDAAGSSPISRTEIYLSGQLLKTLSSAQRSFSYQPNQPGNHSLRIVSYDQDGNSSEDSMSINAAPLIHSSPPLESFTTHDLIYYKGAYYAASDGGRIYISTDGKRWKKIQTPVLGRITSLAANEYAIVASHNGEGILYSKNGITWLNIGDYTTNSVTYHDDLFLTEDNSSPVYSHDGLSWSSPNGSTAGTFTTDNAGAPAAVTNMQKVLKIGPHYLGLATNRIHFSEDLKFWTDVSPPDHSFEDIEIINGIAFAKNHSSITHISGDGLNWIALGETFSDPLLSYSNGYYYALSYGSSANPQYTLIRSTNGIDWTPYGLAIKSNTYSPRFSHLVASEKGVVVTSQLDGSELYYINESSVELVNLFKAIESSSGENIKLIGPNGRFASTSNASFEIDERGNWAPTETFIEKQTAYANGVYIGSWHFGEYRSYDGETWTQFSLPDWVREFDGADVYSLFSEGDSAIWAKISYSIINQNGYSERKYLYIRTTDGVNWSKITPPDEDGIRNLFHLKGETFEINPWKENPTLYKFDETDGTWTSSTISIERGYNFAQTRDYIATIVATNIFVTSDGQNWSTHDLPTTQYTALLATNDAFYLTADQVWKSNNGKDWEVILPYQLYASAEGNRIIFYDDNYQIIETSLNDLAIVDAIVSSKEYAVGDQIEIQTTLSNKGTSTLTWPANSDLAFTFSNSTDSWSLSTPESGFSGTTPIPFTTLEPGESKQLSFEITVPNSIDPDSYYLSLYIEDKLVSKDGNVSNDYFTRTESTPIIVPSRTLTIPYPENGSISGIAINELYAWKEKVILTAVPDFGYQFDG